jgi:cell wall-active antibiotic response 4TMS protein YvqF
MTARRSLSWPLILITIGLVFLLANFGLIPGVTALSLLTLWPLLLILAGVDIAIGRRWPLAALGIDVGVIALGLVLLATQPSFVGGPVFSFGDASGGERDVSVARQSATSLSLDINGGAGQFRVSGGSTLLVEVHSANDDLRVRRERFEDSGQHADVRIDQSGNRHVSGAAIDVEARIASDIPTDLEVNGGAGEFFIDLSSVAVTNAELNVGAASLTLTLPKPTSAVNIEVNAGASSIVIDVPEGVEARVTMNGALLSLRSTNARVTASGSTAETAGYGSATARVTVKVTAGASSITIR